MSTTELLKDAEADLAALAGLPGEIRTKVRAGIAELTRIRDAVDATIGAMTKGARDTLASLETKAAEAAGLVASNDAKDGATGGTAAAGGAEGAPTAPWPPTPSADPAKAGA